MVDQNYRMFENCTFTLNENISSVIKIIYKFILSNNFLNSMNETNPLSTFSGNF